MTSLKSLKRKRDNRIDLEGTPPAIFLNDGDIAVDTNGGGLVIDFQIESKTKMYSPHSVIRVNNNSSSDLNVYVNQNRAWQKLVRAQTALSIKDFPGIRSVRISKRDSGVTITAGQVEVNIEREPLDDDEFRRRELKKPLIRKLISKYLGF